MTAHHKRAVACLLSFVLSAAACAPAPPDTPSSLAQARPVLPLDAYSVSAGAEYLTRVAEDRLIRSCMARRDVPWNPPPISTADARPEFRRYGLASLATARTFGYHIPVDAAHERRNHYFLDTMTRSQRRALEGTAKSPGCRREADATVNHAVPRTFSLLPFELGSESITEAGRTPQVRTAKRNWSTCMSARGYHYATPEAAQADKRWKLDRPRITRSERTAAVADVACKRKASLTNIWATAEAPIQRRLIRLHERQLRAIQTANRVRLTNVRYVIR